MTKGALAGVRVLELTHYIAGPRCGQILSDHGAEVVKLEPPSGDPSRSSAPKHDGWSMYFAAHNRRKKSVALDLKNPRSRPVLDRLIRWADVLVTNYTPDATERLGLDMASARLVNPRIVVVRITAHGLTGPGRDLPGFDGTVQARSGLGHMVGAADGPPTMTSVPITDYLAGVEGAFAALLGLRRRDETGEPQELDVSMMDSAGTLLGFLYAEVLSFGQQPKRAGSRAPYALTTAYEAADGWVYIAPMNPATWNSLCRLAGKEEWTRPGAPFADPDTRLRRRDEVEAGLNEWTRTQSRDRLVELLEEAGVPCGPVNSVADIAVDPLLRERSMLLDVSLGASGRTVPMPGVEIKVAGTNAAEVAAAPVVPELGADTERVLGELGFSGAEVAALRDAGAIRGRARP